MEGCHARRRGSREREAPTRGQGGYPTHGRSPDLDPQLNLSRAVTLPPNKVSHRQPNQHQRDPRIRNQEPPIHTRLADPDHLITLPKSVKDEAHPLGTDIKVPAPVRGAHLRVPLTVPTTSD